MSPRERAWCGLTAALLLACARPGSQRIVGPDGSPMSHVHCGAEQGQCFRIAGELCPSGYDIRPVMSRSDGNFLVRCRDDRPARGLPTAATPALVRTAPPALTSPAPSYAASGASTPSSARPAPDQAGSTEIDLGY